MLRTIYENENRRNRKLGLTMKYARLIGIKLDHVISPSSFSRFEEERSITEGNDVDMAYPYASVD
jgi:hypothetical protein